MRRSQFVAKVILIMILGNSSLFYNIILVLFLKNILSRHLISIVRPDLVFGNSMYFRKSSAVIEMNSTIHQKSEQYV